MSNKFNIFIEKFTAFFTKVPIIDGCFSFSWNLFHSRLSKLSKHGSKASRIVSFDRKLKSKNALMHWFLWKFNHLTDCIDWRKFRWTALILLLATLRLCMRKLKINWRPSIVSSWLLRRKIIVNLLSGQKTFVGNLRIALLARLIDVHRLSPTKAFSWRTEMLLLFSVKMSKCDAPAKAFDWISFNSWFLVAVKNTTFLVLMTALGCNLVKPL